LKRFQELVDKEAATSSAETPAGKLMSPILRMLRGVYFLRSKVFTKMDYLTELRQFIRAGGGGRGDIS
jgi:hypothetical protein